MISSFDPIVRKIVAPHIGPNPFEFQFGPDASAEDQDAQIKQHFAELQAQRDYSSMGPQAALGRLLATAQNAISPKQDQELGPQVIRGATAWGLTPQQVTSSFEALSNRQVQQQQLAQQKAENLARRQQALAEMQQHLDLTQQEHQFNLKVKGLEHQSRLDEKTKEHELNTQLETQKANARTTLEETKAKNKAPKLTSAWDAASGTYTLQPEAKGLVTKGPRSADEINKQAMDYTTHLMSYEFEDDKGNRTPMDFGMASTVAHEMAQGKPVNFEIPGMKLVRRETQDLAGVTDAEGNTTLQPKKSGLQTKEAPEAKRAEMTKERESSYRLAKDELKEAQAELDNMPSNKDDDGYDADRLKGAKKAVADAKANVAKRRKAYNSHLDSSGQPDTQAPSSPEITEKSTDDLASIPDGTEVIDSVTSQRGTVTGGKFVPYVTPKE